VPQTLTVKIDKTLPTVAWGTQSPAANGFGWNNTAVSISYTTADNLSGVLLALPASPLSFTAQGAAQTQTVTVVDVAGNTATIASPAVNIDTTPPTVTAATNPSLAERNNGNNGTRTRNVTISGAVTDLLSGADPSVNAGTFSITDSKSATVLTGTFTVLANGTYSFSRPLSIANSGFSVRVFTITVSAKDKAGNTGTATTTFRVF
jgi:hypothetical protein